MRIVEERKYTMYLSVEEFDLMYPLTKDIPYGYRCITNNNDDRESYIITLNESMLDDIGEALKYAEYVQEYEECNRFAAKEIRDLSDSIYYELKYSYDYDGDDLDPFENIPDDELDDLLNDEEY